MHRLSSGVITGIPSLRRVETVGIILQMAVAVSATASWERRQSIEVKSMDDWDDYDRCYECRGYGDDYYYDAETDDWVSACTNCPFNEWKDEWND